MKMQAFRSGARHGFTLIEILVVVVILAILAAVVVPNVLSRIGDAKNSAAMADIKNFDNAIDQYRLDNGTLPPSLDALVNKSASGGNPKWNGPYLKNLNAIPMDPWGNPYIYKAPGDQGRDYDISSAGADAQPGTPDDITSWNPTGH